MNAEEEFKNALDEIKKAERDFSLVATIAQTLLEKTQSQQKEMCRLEDETNSSIEKVN